VWKFSIPHLKVSQQREYLADSSGAYLTRNPMGLASALEKIKDQNTNTKVNGVVQAVSKLKSILQL
jgi:Zn-dependent protease with chaperone function